VSGSAKTPMQGDRIKRRQVAATDPRRGEFIDAVRGGRVEVGGGVAVVPSGWSGGHPTATIEVQGVPDTEVRAATGLRPAESRNSADAVTDAIVIRNWRGEAP
jgi:hypothetical protein